MTFTVENILATAKVPRGRRPNAKYPRVQACKSMSPFGIGMFPLMPVTQPFGFLVKNELPEEMPVKEEADCEEENKTDKKDIEEDTDDQE